jgi:hypothetical protein
LTAADLVMVGALLIAGAADMLSTRYALSRGARELNPLMRNPVLAYGLKAGMLAVIALVCRGMREAGAPGFAAATCALAVAFWLALAVHNVQVARRLKR